MNIYLIINTNFYGFNDGYESAIVVAHNECEATEMSPVKTNRYDLEYFEKDYSYDGTLPDKPSVEWCAFSYVHVKFLGLAFDGAHVGVLSSKYIKVDDQRSQKV